MVLSRRLAMTILLIGLAGSSGASVYIYQQRSSQENLNEEVTSLQNRISALNAEIHALDLQIAQLQTLNSQLGGNNTQLSSQIQQLRSQVSSLQTQTTSLQNQIGSLNVGMDSLRSQVQQLQSQVSQLQSQLADLQTQLQSSSPATNFNYNPRVPAAGSTVTFTALVLGGRPPYSYRWSFGDGSAYMGEAPSHVFEVQGAYTVTLTVDDSASPENSATYSQVVTVLNHPQVHPTDQYWATFYYPWYCNLTCNDNDTLSWRHWHDPCDSTCLHNPPETWSSSYLPDDSSGGFNPAIQLYSSLNTTVLDRHLTMMDYARFDFSIVSWWGRSSFEDKAFKLMLSRVQANSSLQLSLATYYECEGRNRAECEDPSRTQPDEEMIFNDLIYIYNYTTDPRSYFKVGPQALPVVFVYGDPNDSCGYQGSYVDRWSRARDRMYAAGKPMFIVLKVFPGYESCQNKVDSWHQYDPKCGRPLLPHCGPNYYPKYQNFSAFVSPGYEEYPELEIKTGNPLVSRNQSRFDSDISWLANQDATFYLVETFNEWHEGSQIEPGIPIHHNHENSFKQAGDSYRLVYLTAVKNRDQS